ncbi:hypothetical protein Dda_4683 [Drechslerella dactyloides]|uniref:Uncharacterized protein n=1 Tax=Drechslerella dactyloides TaxID=74499 RepID=A0AAD6J1R7_DREDA|nr:hypothetical protein Dda_4683 [Drechslerella dactyloides]
MPAWKEKCIKLKLQRDLPSSTHTHKHNHNHNPEQKRRRARIFKLCIPSSKTVSSTLHTLTAPARNPYFYLWLFLSWVSTDLEDGIQLAPPLADFYDFLKGGTEPAAFIRGIDVLRNFTWLLGNPIVSWLVFLGWRPENLNAAFESLAYYDDWFAAYRLARLVVPDLWGLAKRFVLWLLGTTERLSQGAFIAFVVVPFATFNFFVVRKVSPALAVRLHRQFEGNAKVWETHLIQPLVCWFLVSLSSLIPRMRHR